MVVFGHVIKCMRNFKEWMTTWNRMDNHLESQQSKDCDFLYVGFLTTSCGPINVHCRLLQIQTQMTMYNEMLSKLSLQIMVTSLDVCLQGAPRYTAGSVTSLNFKETHGIANDTERNRNFKCPFNCGLRASRTNKESLYHCKAVHHDKLGYVRSQL